MKQVGTAFADGSTVTISSMPNLTVASMPLRTITDIMVCTDMQSTGSGTSGVLEYRNCDSTDNNQTLSGSSFSITHDDAFSAGWRLYGPGCGGGASVVCFLFYK